MASPESITPKRATELEKEVGDNHGHDIVIEQGYGWVFGALAKGVERRVVKLAEKIKRDPVLENTQK